MFKSYWSECQPTMHANCLVTHTYLLACLFSLLLGINIPALAQERLPETPRPGETRPATPAPSTAPPLADIPYTDAPQIPSVIDRPFAEDEGPFVKVTSFRLLGVRDMPAHDISGQEIKDKIIAAKITEQPTRGYSIGQLQTIADQISNYYRKRGFILAQAIIPVQDVEHGVVDIEVIEGRLGRVLIESEDDYKPEVLSAPFADQIGEAVLKDNVERALLELTEYPGLNIFGVFQPGQLVGEADILLKVQEEKKLEASVRADNHGLDMLGKERLRANIYWNNVTGNADKISIFLQQSFNPSASNFSAVSYDLTFPSDVYGGLSWFKGNLQVAGELLDNEITTETKVISAYLKKQWLRGRQLNLSSQVSFNVEQSQTSSREQLASTEALSVLSTQFDLELVDTRFGGVNFASLEWRHGFNDLLGSLPGDPENIARELRPSREGANGELPTGEFDLVTVNFTRLQTINPNNTLLLRADFQYSPDLLASLAQFFVGGPDSVRGLIPSAESWDTGMLLSVEWFIDAPFISDVPAFNNRTWGDIFELSLFYDYAAGKINRPSDITDEGFFGRHAAGVGAYIYLPFGLDARFILARELGSNTDDPARPNESGAKRIQFWGEISFDF